MADNDFYYLTMSYSLLGTGIALLLYSKLIGVLEEIRDKKSETKETIEDIEEEEV